MEQVARVFWTDTNTGIKLATRRLRLFYDWHLIDRYYQLVIAGASKAYIVLDTAGAKVLELKKFNKMEKLPYSFNHYLTVTEFCILAQQMGLSGEKIEEKIGPVIADIYYPNSRIAVEIDMGTERNETLLAKAKKYSRIDGLQCIIFITTGSKGRITKFIDHLTCRSRKAGAQTGEVRELLTALLKKPGA